jgi:hypothetical protein
MVLDELVQVSLDRDATLAWLGEHLNGQQVAA